MKKTDSEANEMGQRMMENWQKEQFGVMWAFLEKGGMKSNIPCLKEHCMMLRQMMMQKTAGQRENKKNDIPFDQLDTIKNIIVVEAMALVLSGDLGKIKDL